MVIPICYRKYGHTSGPKWIWKHFKRTFKTELKYMLWLGETASLSGNECIQANCVAALALAELG